MFISIIYVGQEEEYGKLCSKNPFGTEPGVLVTISRQQKSGHSRDASSSSSPLFFNTNLQIPYLVTMPAKLLTPQQEEYREKIGFMAGLKGAAIGIGLGALATVAVYRSSSAFRALSKPMQSVMIVSGNIGNANVLDVSNNVANRCYFWLSIFHGSRFDRI